VGQRSVGATLSAALTRARRCAPLGALIARASCKVHNGISFYVNKTKVKVPGGSACGRASTLPEASKQDVEAALPGPSASPASDPAPASPAAPRPGGASSCRSTARCTPKSRVAAAGTYDPLSGTARRGACKCVRDGCPNAATLRIWTFKAWDIRRRRAAAVGAWLWPTNAACKSTPAC
jgi:hypothetical protein